MSTFNRGWCCLVLVPFWLLVGTALLASNWVTTGAEADPPVNGSYRDERVTVELNQAAAGGKPGSYTGVIRLADQQFPLKAEREENRLTGTFEADGDRYEFSATIVGHMLVFTTGGTTYRLKKQTANPLGNPLAQSARPNPLALPKTKAPAPTNYTAVPAEAKPLSVPPSAPQVPIGSVLRLHPFLIPDDIVILGDAFRCLLPPGWQIEGGLAWRLHPTVPTCLDLRATNPIRTEMLQIFPTIPFVWADEGIPLFPAGSIYMGNEVAEPVADPVLYVRRVVLTRFRKYVTQPKVIATEELPGVAETVARTAQEPGIQKTFRAARVRLEYPEMGRDMQEDVYCVLTTAYAPAIKTTFWGAERNYAFKGEKGKLEESTKLLQTIFNSFQPTLPWFNRYVQLILTMGESGAIVRQISEVASYVPRTTTEVTEPRRLAYEHQLEAQAHLNKQLSQFLKGTQQYRNPVENRLVDLPVGFARAWASASGDYLLLEDPNFDPNAGSTNKWERLVQP